MPRGIYDRSKLKAKTPKAEKSVKVEAKTDAPQKRKYTKRAAASTATTSNLQDDLNLLHSLVAVLQPLTAIPVLRDAIKDKIANVLNRIEPITEVKALLVEETVVEPKKAKHKNGEHASVVATPIPVASALPFNPQVPPTGN